MLRDAILPMQGSGSVNRPKGRKTEKNWGRR